MVEKSEIAIRSGLAGVAGFVSLIKPEIGVVLFAANEVAVPATQTALHSAKSKILERRSAQAEEVCAIAFDDLTAEAVSRLLDGTDDARLQLLAQCVEGAMVTALHSKIRLFGKILKEGLLQDDPAVVDVASLRVRALVPIESPHVRLLAVIAGDKSLLPGTENHRGWKSSELTEILPRYAAALEALLPTLSASGFVVDVSIGQYGGWKPGEERWEITSFGKDCLDMLKQEGVDE